MKREGDSAVCISNNNSIIGGTSPLFFLKCTEEKGNEANFDMVDLRLHCWNFVPFSNQHKSHCVKGLGWVLNFTLKISSQS